MIRKIYKERKKEIEFKCVKFEFRNMLKIRFSVSCYKHSLLTIYYYYIVQNILSLSIVCMRVIMCVRACMCVLVSFSVRAYVCVYGIYVFWCFIYLYLYHCFYYFHCLEMFKSKSFCCCFVFLLQLYHQLNCKLFLFSILSHVCQCSTVLLLIFFIQPITMFRNILLLLFVRSFFPLLHIFRSCKWCEYRWFLHFSPFLFSILLQNQQFNYSK